MKASRITLVLVLLLASICQAQLRSNRVEAKLGEITQLRPEFELPEGFKVATQRWLPVYVNGKCHGVSFDSGTVFAVTSATPGSSMRVLWDLVLVNWDKQEFQQVSREYLVDFEGSPPPDPDPDPTPPDDLTDLGKTVRRLGKDKGLSAVYQSIADRLAAKTEPVIPTILLAFDALKLAQANQDPAWVAIVEHYNENQLTRQQTVAMFRDVAAGYASLP